MDDADKFVHAGTHRGKFATTPNLGPFPDSAAKSSSVATHEAITSEDQSATNEEPTTFRDERELFLCGGVLSSATEAAVGIRYPHTAAAAVSDMSPFAKRVAIEGAPYPTRNHHMRL